MTARILALRNRWNRLTALAERIEAERHAVRNGLLVAGDDDPAPAAPYEYTEREMRAAHTLHAAGERTPWVDEGERAYQRTKKREERARRAS